MKFRDVISTFLRRGERTPPPPPTQHKKKKFNNKIKRRYLNFLGEGEKTPPPPETYTEEYKFKCNMNIIICQRYRLHMCKCQEPEWKRTKTQHIIKLLIMT